MQHFISCALVVSCVPVVAATTSCAPRAAPNRSHDGRDIERVAFAITDSVAAAVGRKDVPRLAAVLADAQYIGSGMLIPPGRFAEMAGPAFQQIAAITLTWGQREIRLVAPDAALMTARGTNVTRDPSGKATREDGLYTMVFTSDSAGTWRLVSIHKTIVAGVPPTPGSRQPTSQ